VNVSESLQDVKAQFTERKNRRILVDTRRTVTYIERLLEIW
jgi:hypothetical protein